MRISDWSSDVYSSDLPGPRRARTAAAPAARAVARAGARNPRVQPGRRRYRPCAGSCRRRRAWVGRGFGIGDSGFGKAKARFPLAMKHTAPRAGFSSEEHKSELQSLMRTSYAVFCLNKKQTQTINESAILRRIHIDK